MLKQMVVFCALLVFASAFLEIAPLDPIPEKYKDQKGCYIKELDVVIPFRKTTPSKERCVEYRCYETRVIIAGCGVIVAAPPCEVTETNDKLFPDCCPTIRCPEI